MLLSELQALSWTSRILGFAIGLQTVEFLLMRREWQDDQVWSWRVIRDEFAFLPGLVRRGFDQCLAPSGFSVLLGVRLLAALMMIVFPHFVPAVILFLSTVLISLRWRGTFNGGSDFMTLIVSSALCGALAVPQDQELGIACLWYIALQTCASYFLAGWAKIKKAGWRSGRALRGFLSATIYEPHPALGIFGRSTVLACAASWMVLLLECLFPITLVHPSVCLPILGVAMFFHIGNALIFGLNRFVWAWIAAYPSLYFCSQLTLSGSSG